MIEVKISEASTYYIAVSHLNMRDIEVIIMDQVMTSD